MKSTNNNGKKHTISNKGNKNIIKTKKLNNLEND